MVCWLSSVVGVTDPTFVCVVAVTFTVSRAVATGSAMWSMGEVSEATVIDSVTMSKPLCLTVTTYSPNGTAAKWNAPLASVCVCRMASECAGFRSTSADAIGRCCWS